MQQCNRHIFARYPEFWFFEKALFWLVQQCNRHIFARYPEFWIWRKALFSWCNSATGIFTYSFWMKIKKRFLSYLMQLRNKQFFTHGVKNEPKKRFLGWFNNATGIYSHDTLNFGFLKKRFLEWCNNATGKFSHDTLNSKFGKSAFLGATLQQTFSHTHSF